MRFWVFLVYCDGVGCCSCCGYLKYSIQTFPFFWPPRTVMLEGKVCHAEVLFSSSFPFLSFLAFIFGVDAEMNELS